MFVTEMFIAIYFELIMCLLIRKDLFKIPLLFLYSLVNVQDGQPIAHSSRLAGAQESVVSNKIACF